MTTYWFTRQADRNLGEIYLYAAERFGIPKIAAGHGIGGGGLDPWLDALVAGELSYMPGALPAARPR